MFIIPFLDMIDNEEDKERFTYCYLKYKNLLYNLAYERLNDVQLAEDAVQDAYFYIAKNFEKIGDEKSPESRSYIACVARTRANKIAEKNKKYVLVDDETLEDYIDEESILLEDEFIVNSNIEALNQAIQKLPEIYKYPIMFKCIYNYKSKELAELFDVSDDAIRRRIYLGKKKLKKLLEGVIKLDEQ